jgi:hypothetical protein
MNKMNKLILIMVLLITIGCKEEESSLSNSKINTEETSQNWSYENAQQYNRSQFEEDKWDMKILKTELGYVDKDPWPTQPPINKLPFPVAKYGKGYNGYASKGIELNIGEKQIKGASFAVSTNEYSIEPKHNPEKSNIIFFNILVLTDKPESENSSNSVSSRNYPHHTCQGRRKTSIGNVDWFAMHLATGVKFATISTKYFNLDFGQTILVAPQKDGSLRFKQMDLPMLSTDEIDGHLAKIEGQKDVIEFFKKESNI